MTREERDDLRATAESIVTDAERLKQVEQRKQSLEPSDDGEVIALAGEAEQIAEDISHKAGAEKELAGELAESP